MREIIDKIIVDFLHFTDAKIIAGLQHPCTSLNSPCYDIKGNFVPNPPCIWAPRGYQADSYIYALPPHTYVFALPVIANGKGGNQSTFHQDHVLSIHRSAFNKQRSYINLMINNTVPCPSFLRPACDASKTLPPMETVSDLPKCQWSNIQRTASQIKIHWVSHNPTDISANSTIHHLREVFGTNRTSSILPFKLLDLEKTNNSKRRGRQLGNS